MVAKIWSSSALLPQGWAESVEIRLDDEGNIAQVATDVTYSGGERAAVLIPGIANVHSHAHQRAMAGLGERAGQTAEGAKDSFCAPDDAGGERPYLPGH